MYGLPKLLLVIAHIHHVRTMSVNPNCMAVHPILLKTFHSKRKMAALQRSHQNERLYQISSQSILWLPLLWLKTSNSKSVLHLSQNNPPHAVMAEHPLAVVIQAMQDNSLFEKGSFSGQFHVFYAFEVENNFISTTETNMLFLLQTNCRFYKVLFCILLILLYNIYCFVFYFVVDTVVLLWLTFAIALGLLDCLLMTFLRDHTGKESPWDVRSHNSSGNSRGKGLTFIELQRIKIYGVWLWKSFLRSQEVYELFNAFLPKNTLSCLTSNLSLARESLLLILDLVSLPLLLGKIQYIRQVC